MPKIVRTTSVPKLKNYKGYKKYLRKDFTYKCIFCAIHENEFGGYRNFHVEHHKPKSLFPGLITTYSNLTYSCCVCNVYKGVEWPSDDPLADGVGFPDPCECDYDEQFSVNADGVVTGSTPIGKYLVETLHLNRKHITSIRRRRLLRKDMHDRIVNLVEETLAVIKNALENKELPEDYRKTLIMSKEAITVLYEFQLEEWRTLTTPMGWSEY
ncbi:MAG: hypothetical protein HGA45_06805 [Chloroflexales bacterium]|nr:hypothetical protein [Chloroflexales bacterium]